MLALNNYECQKGGMEMNRRDRVLKLIVEYFIKNPTNEKFINVSPSESIQIVDIANIVNDFSDFKSEIIIKNKGLNKEYTANNSRLLSKIGQFKFTSYSNGINKLYKQKKNNS